MIMNIRVLLVLLLPLEPTGRRGRYQIYLSGFCPVLPTVLTSPKTTQRLFFLPSHKYVAGFFTGEDVVILENNLICIPDDHPQFEPRGRDMGLIVKAKNFFKLAMMRTKITVHRKTTNVLLWFSWRDVKGWARCRHVFRKHVDPHFNSPLWSTEQT